MIGKNARWHAQIGAQMHQNYKLAQTSPTSSIRFMSSQLLKGGTRCSRVHASYGD